MWKICKYTLLDLARNRFALGYAALLMLISASLFMLEGDATKALISLSEVLLALVPLITLVFTIIWSYNQYEFTVLLAVQPLRRQSIIRGLFSAISIALLVSFLVGVGLPVMAFAPGPTGWTLFLTGAALTVVFTALGLLIAVSILVRCIGFIVMMAFALYAEGRPGQDVDPRLVSAFATSFPRADGSAAQAYPLTVIFAVDVKIFLFGLQLVIKELGKVGGA